MPIRVVVHEDRPLKEALVLLSSRLRAQTIDDYIRHRRWGVEFHQKPGYVLRQEKFFAKARARKCERWRRRTGEQYPSRW